MKTLTLAAMLIVAGLAFWPEALPLHYAAPALAALMVAGIARRSWQDAKEADHVND